MNEEVEAQEEMTQSVQISKFKKYVDGSTTMSYMVNVDNSGLLFSDDDGILKTYTIEGKEFDYLRVFIPKDMKDQIEPIEVELKRPLVDGDSIDMWIMRNGSVKVDDEVRKMSDIAQITYILPSTARKLRVRQCKGNEE